MQAFRAIFAHPGTKSMTTAALVGRFPMAMLGLAVTLLVVLALYARFGRWLLPPTSALSPSPAMSQP